MAGGKLSPRQKMIGMMYLVLTALLALNISKEIVLAFVLINTGIEQTVDNFEKKNALTYAAFDFAEKNNPAKVKSYNDKAKLVRKLSDELFSYIDGIKKDLMAKSDGLEQASRDTITLPWVEKKDENNIPHEILIGQNVDGSQGKARELKDNIAEYRKKLMGIVSELDPGYAQKLNIGLDTNDPPKDKEGIGYSWEVANFGHIPLAPVVTLLSKLQSDVRNAEADLINYLFTKVDAGDFKFDTLAAKVIPKLNYVVIGQEYEADVFVAAFSTTQNPKVYVGNVDTIKNELIGAKDSVPVDRGVGKYKRKPATEGIQKWGGIVEVKSPDGTIKSYPFKAEYISAKPSAVVSPEKMNVLYIGIPNPLAISVAGVPDEKVSVSISQGSLSGAKGKFSANVNKVGEAVVSVFAEIEKNKKQNMGDFKFRVKQVPDPVAKVAGKKEGIVSKGTLAAQAGVIAQLENFEFEGVNFIVTSFEMTITGKGREMMVAKSNNNLITADMQAIISKARIDDKVYFESIRAVGPGGPNDIRALGSISFVVK